MAAAAAAEQQMAWGIEARDKRVLLLVPSSSDDAENDVAFSAARALLANGCKVVLVTAETPISLLHVSPPSLVAPATSHGHKLEEEENVRVVNLDMGKPIQHAVEDAVDAGWAALGAIDVLLTFSSLTDRLIPFLQSTLEHLDSAVNVNLKYAYLFSIAIVKRMQQADIGGSIIFVTSVIGTERGLFPGAALAGASIAAVNHLTRAMAMELGKFRIRVNAIARGLVKSDALLKSLGESQVQREGERLVPLRRWLDGKKDLSAMILYLAGDMSSFMTGTVIFVDGGQSLVRPRMRSLL